MSLFPQISTTRIKYLEKWTIEIFRKFDYTVYVLPDKVWLHFKKHYY